MKVLVTGGAGFIGSHIVEHFQGKAEVRVLDSLRSGYKSNLDVFDVEFIEGDIRDRETVRKAMEGIDDENAKLIRTTLDELVEVVDDESAVAKSKEEYLNEFEDEIDGIDVDEKISEEIQQVEYLVCPSCEFEFEYNGQTACPSCKVEFEFDEEEEEEYEEVEEEEEVVEVVEED